MSRTPGGLYPHSLDPTSLVTGLAFIIIGLLAVISPSTLHDGGLLLPMLGIVAGIAIMGSVLSRTPSEPTPTRGGPVTPATPVTPERIRQEDAAWFDIDTPMTDIEREIAEALAREDAASADADQPDGHEGKDDSEAL